MQKLFRYLVRFFFFAVFTAFVGVFVYAFIIEVNNEDPGDYAPFAESGDLNSPPAIPLNEPNRTTGELQDWISKALVGALTFDAISSYAKIREVRPYFSPEGHDEYRNYINSAEILPVLQKGDKRVSGYIEEPPFLVTQGLVGPSYRWAFEVPMTLSILPRGAVSYQSNPDLQNLRVIVRLQIGRVNDAEHAEGLQIEKWSVFSRSK